MLLPDMVRGSRNRVRRYPHGPKARAAGLAVEQDVDAELNFRAAVAVGRSALEKIAREVGLLNPALTDVRETRVSVIDGLRDRIAITVTSASSSEGARDAGSIYGIVYQIAIAARSLKVVGELSIP